MCCMKLWVWFVLLPPVMFSHALCKKTHGHAKTPNKGPHSFQAIPPSNVASKLVWLQSPWYSEAPERRYQRYSARWWWRRLGLDSWGPTLTNLWGPHNSLYNWFLGPVALYLQQVDSLGINMISPSPEKCLLQWDVLLTLRISDWTHQWFRVNEPI